MSLITKVPRPPRREIRSLRDDRLFLVACDDTYAPKQYFDFFAIPRVQVHVIATEDGTSSAPDVLDRLLAIDAADDDHRWMLLDRDHCTQDAHLASFTRALKRAKDNHVEVALSRPCFEIWLLLHHVNENAVALVKNAKEVESLLSTTLGIYDKTRLKRSDYSLARLATASDRAERLDARTLGRTIPATATTRVYKLWRDIISSVSAAQRPEQLRHLAD